MLWIASTCSSTTLVQPHGEVDGMEAGWTEPHLGEFARPIRPRNSASCQGEGRGFKSCQRNWSSWGEQGNTGRNGSEPPRSPGPPDTTARRQQRSEDAGPHLTREVGRRGSGRVGSPKNPPRKVESRSRRQCGETSIAESISMTCLRRQYPANSSLLRQ